MKKEILAEVDDELQAALKKFPKWPTDPLHAAAIVAEEMGELQRAILQVIYEPGGRSTIEDVRKEAVQTAAMAIRFLYGMDDYVFNKAKQVSQ